MRLALKQNGAPAEIHVYPEAPHGFFADYRASYTAVAANDGWIRMVDWLQRHGATSSLR